MPKYAVIGIIALTMTAVLIVSCGGSGDSESDETVFAPVSIANCTTPNADDSDPDVEAASTTYNQPPSRAVTMNQHATEIMLDLGLQDRMVGTAYIDDYILPEFQDAYDSVPVLAEEYPSKEVLLNAEPDFIYAGFSSAFREAAAGPQADLAALGISSYMTIALCDDRPDTMDDVYADILNIGRIFGVEDRANPRVDSMKEVIRAVTDKVGDTGEPLRVFLYDSGDDAPYTSVCCSMFSSLVQTVGGQNIFNDVSGRWKTVNWEEVIVRDPEVIVLTEAVWSTSKEKRDFLLSNSALADITAVKNQRFVVLQFSSLIPSIRNPGAIKQLAEGIYPERFQ